MVGKRSRLEMYLDVLEKIDQGIRKPTNIMYKCNLSWHPLQNILTSLIERELIREIKKHNHKYYEITEKGRQVLIYLKKLIQILRYGERKPFTLSNGKQKIIIPIQQNLDTLFTHLPQDKQKRK